MKYKILLLPFLLIMIAGCGHKAYVNDSVLFINVGKADSALVQKSGRSYLIDTGTSESYEKLSKTLKLKGVDRLDGVILTHTDKDHVGGFKELYRDYSIGSFYASEYSTEPEIYDELSQLSGIKVEKLSFGDMIDNIFEVVSPIRYDKKDENNNSVVLKMTMHQKIFLFAGDMCHDEEKLLIESGADIRADILKVAHHGYNDATGKDFINAVNPKIAVISTDTSIEPDSANEKVIKRLDKCDVYITENFNPGILIEFNKNGEMNISQNN